MKVKPANIWHEFRTKHGETGIKLMLLQTQNQELRPGDGKRWMCFRNHSGVWLSDLVL